jgi:hypothetical protein
MTYQYFINGITQHYADFKGRARRSQGNRIKYV